MYGNNAAPKPIKKGNQKLAQLMAHLDSEDEDYDDEGSSFSQTATSTPWALEFNQYLNGADEVANGVSLTHWWGVSFYPY
jgi:hypothetical protein